MILTEQVINEVLGRLDEKVDTKIDLTDDKHLAKLEYIMLFEMNFPLSDTHTMLQRLVEIKPTDMVSNPNPKGRAKKVQYQYAQQWLDDNPDAETSDDFKKDVGKEKEEDDDVDINPDITDGMNTFQKRAYLQFKNKSTASYKNALPFLDDEDKELMDDYEKDLDKLLLMTDDEEKKKHLEMMVEKYGLSQNASGSKLYIGKISFDARKILGNDISESNPNYNVVKDLERLGVEMPIAKTGAGGPKQKATTASKIKMTTIHKDDDPVVQEVFGLKEFNHMQGPKGKKYRQLHGVSDDKGNLKKSGGENSLEYLKHSINPEENPTMDNVEKQLEELEKTDKLNPKVRQSVKDHRQRMKDLTEGKVIGSDGKPIKVPSKEAADYVQKSWSTMALGFHEGSPGMADAMMKNLAEMAEYQRELAKGDEVYLPSSGVFPSGDKLLVTRDGEGKAVNISSVSIKYGKKGKYKAYGFPGEAGKYQEYHPDPAYRDRLSSVPGEDGYDIGVKNEIVEDDKEYEKMLKDSGLEEVIKDKKCLQDKAKEFKEGMVKLKKGVFGDGKVVKNQLKRIKDAAEKLNKEIGKRMVEECLNNDKLDERLGPDNAKLFRRGPMEAMNILTFSGTLRTSDGLKTITHNHQTIQKDKDGNVSYENHTDEGSPDIKEWFLNFRAFDDRAGGLISSYNSERKEL